MDKKNKNNPFRKAGEGGIEKTKKETEWGKVKFNPVAKAAATEQATPWSHFKNEIIQKQQNDEYESQEKKNNPNAKEFLKKREENYRKNLIESQRNVPTQWEDFSDETAAPTSKAKKNKVPLNGKFQSLPSKIENLESIKKGKFDARDLTSSQNNFLKRVITSKTMRKKGSSFDKVVSDLKRNGVKKKQFKPFKK